MDVIKFDKKIHGLERAAELVLSAYDFTSADSGHTRRTVMSLIDSGNNFLGHENMYVSIESDIITGLVVCYAGKPGGAIHTLLRLLIELRLKELISLIILNAELFHTGYTPELCESDFYISLVVVDEKHRGKGLGKRLIQKAIEVADEKGCTKALLDVDSDNGAAIALYEKLGFTMKYENPKSVKGALPSKIYTMEYSIVDRDHKIKRRIKA